MKDTTAQEKHIHTHVHRRQTAGRILKRVQSQTPNWSTHGILLFFSLVQFSPQSLSFACTGASLNFTF